MGILFNKGDKEYFQWMNENQDGFILNTGKREGTTAFILHKSNCSHITEYDSFDDKAYTTRDWVKVASNDVADISKYCQENKRNFKGKFKICKSCKPEFDLSKIIYPDDLQVDEKELIEGAKKYVIVNSYERNPKARGKCIDHYGCKCQCCEMEFKYTYGEIGNGFIHVHHTKQLSDIGERYVVNPIEDLRPLCPNCHAMIHKRNPPYSLDELKEIMNHPRASPEEFS